MKFSHHYCTPAHRKTWYNFGSWAIILAFYETKDL